MAKRPRPQEFEYQWEAFDPSWLVDYANQQEPPEFALSVALSDCRWARRNSCCSDRVCGFQFFGEGHPDPAKREPQPFARGTTVLFGNDEFGDVAVDVCDDGAVGAIEFL